MKRKKLLEEKKIVFENGITRGRKGSIEKCAHFKEVAAVTEKKKFTF